MDAVESAENGMQRGEERAHHRGNALFLDDRDAADADAIMKFCSAVRISAPVVHCDMVSGGSHSHGQRLYRNLHASGPGGEEFVSDHRDFQEEQTFLSGIIHSGFF